MEKCLKLLCFLTVFLALASVDTLAQEPTRRLIGPHRFVSKVDDKINSSERLTFGQRILTEVDSGYGGKQGPWDVTINAGEVSEPLTATGKLHYALHEEFSITSILTAARSAGWEQLVDADPHYGSDRAAYGERFGAAAFRQGTDRLFGDGVFAAISHEDPRYFRLGSGGILHRSAGSIVQVVIRRRDNGSRGISYSGLAGHALSEGLPITFYPSSSAKSDVVLKGFGTSLAADAGVKLMREFLPDLFRMMKLIPSQ